MMEEKERLKYTIDRFDHYYDSVNNKSNVFLTLSVFIFGALVAFYPTVLEKVDCGFWVYTLMIIPMVIGLLTMGTVVITARPFLSRERDSLIYFQSVSNMTAGEFAGLSENQNEEQELSDLRKQAHTLAKGLNTKFRRMRMVATLFIMQFVMFIPLACIITMNLKK